MLELDKTYLDQMVAHALEDSPNECCGILAGPQSKVVHLYRMTNTEHSPYRYNMDAKELYLTYREIEDKKWDLVAIYHRHPFGHVARGVLYPGVADGTGQSVGEGLQDYRWAGEGRGDEGLSTIVAAACIIPSTGPLVWFDRLTTSGVL